MKIIFPMMLVVVLLAGCNLEFLDDLKELNDKYCSETNKELQEAMKHKIQDRWPDWPGECKIKETIETFADKTA